MDRYPEMGARDHEGLARIFRYFGEIETPRLDSRVYTEYSLGVAEDEALLSLVAEVDPGQPAPNILFAAVQDLLLEDAAFSPEAKALAEFYPSVTTRPIPDRTAWPAFRDFCLAHGDRLAPKLRSGRTQTCVVHRCTSILPAIASLPRVRAAKGRVGLLEIGPSAGLNLRLDHYRYEYGTELSWGNPNALPKLTCEIRGKVAPPLPDRLEVAARRGLDLNRIDLEDLAELRWLRALVWPEHTERAKAMDEALALAETVPVKIEEGDATLEIGAQLGLLPTDAARVLFATQVFYQIPSEGRRAILEGIAKASREAPVDLIVVESTGEGDSQIDWFGFEKGERVNRTVLARADSHGRWIEWGEWGEC